MLSADDKVRRTRLTERLRSLRERTHLLELELYDYTSQYFRVCIFGSARIGPEDEIYEKTQRLACLLGECGIDVLTGGGPGLMEAANRGHVEGKRHSGAKSRSIGLPINLGQLEQPNDHLDIKHHHRRFSSRLDDFMRLSNVVVVMPGGIGTLLELFFSWQLLQVGHTAERPVLLVGRSFWSGLIDWVKTQQVDRGLISSGDLAWIKIVDTPEEVMETVMPEHKNFTQRFHSNGHKA